MIWSVTQSPVEQVGRLTNAGTVIIKSAVAVS